MNIVALLEWAGEKLLALQVRSPKPAGYRTYWPNFALDPHEAYGYTPASVRAPIPTSSEISTMDEILSWTSLISTKLRRRAVGLRSLVHPVRQSHVLNWNQIGAIMGLAPYRARNLYVQGVEELVRCLPADSIVTELNLIDARIYSTKELLGRVLGMVPPALSRCP